MIEFKWYDKNLNVMIENNTINKIKNWQNKIKEIKDDLEKDKIFNQYVSSTPILMTKIMHIMDPYGCTDRYRYLDTRFLNL